MLTPRAMLTLYAESPADMMIDKAAILSFAALEAEVSPAAVSQMAEDIVDCKCLFLYYGKALRILSSDN